MLKHFEDVAALSLITCLTRQMPGYKNYPSVRQNEGICPPLCTHVSLPVCRMCWFNYVEKYCVSASHLRCINPCVNLDDFDRCQSVV